MRTNKLIKSAAASLAVVLSLPALAADYFVVVPVPGRTVAAANIQVSLAPGSLPGAVLGEPYAGFNLNSSLTVTGDAEFTGAGVQWAVISGALPAGLTLNADGTISGTPTSAGTSSFSVRATYKTKSGEQAYQVVTTDITVALTAATLPSATQGQAYTYDFKSQLSVSGDPGYTSGSGVSWALSSGNLPTGLSLDSATGVVSGTPSAAGTSSFSVRATYKQRVGTRAYTIATSAPYSTWNLLDKGPNVSLNGSTATVPGGSTVRATVGKSTGKWYWEVKVTSAEYGTIMGVANLSASLNSYVGSTGNSYGIMAAPPNPFGYECFNGCGSNALAQFAKDDVIGFALDMDTRTLRIYRNGTLKLTSSGLPAGTLYPAVGGQAAGTYLANFGNGGFWRAPPAGYSALQ